MQCYDCASGQELTTNAVAVCATCGAGMCAEHTLLGYAEKQLPTIGNPTATRLPGRRLFCGTCVAAYTVATTTSDPGRKMATVG